MVETALEPGALAVLTADTPRDEGWSPRRAGTEFVIEEFCPALTPDDDGYGDAGVLQGDFYYGNAEGGLNNVVVPASIVKQVKSAAEMAARKIPSLREASVFVSDGLIDAFDADMFETSISGPDNAPEVEAYGRTTEGLGFGMRVAVLEVWVTDD